MSLNPKLELDTFLGEKPHENEEELTQQIADLIVKSIAFDANKRKAHDPQPKFPALRDAHPKANGCAQAEFQIRDDLPPDLARGIFQPGRKYRALIRFSNGNPDPMRPDARADARGM